MQKIKIFAIYRNERHFWVLRISNITSSQAAYGEGREPSLRVLGDGFLSNLKSLEYTGPMPRRRILDGDLGSLNILIALD